MSPPESVESRVAAGLITHLQKARQDVDDALATWRSTLDEAHAARERSKAARTAALAAQLQDDEDAEQLTRRAAEEDAAADRCEHLARQARRALAAVVEDAEILALRARTTMAGARTACTERVHRRADGLTQHTAGVRMDARLGPSPEEASVRAGVTRKSERTDPPTKPAWERLVVMDDDERALLDGVEYRLPRVAGAKMLRLLVAERGGLVAAHSIERITGARPRRELRRLPEPIAALVEAPGRERRGYRLFDAVATEGRLRP